jgi:translation initiation factor IF-1
MAKEELIQFEGLVTEILPDARYRVQLDAGHEIVAYTAGKMKKNRIKTLAGDRVTIEMSPYDLEKGRLIFRHKDERPSTGAPRGGPPRGGPLRRRSKRPKKPRNRARQSPSRAIAEGCPAESKNRARQDCFGPCYRIILSIDFRPDDISYPPVQPV